ncbi:hypothetical protein [Noviherbaspirillum malthae]|uniref:hypothetical protein n=1 Tax=Noviherbaspirillum malthae TaxID=1260987 RepID=UPI001890B1C5|nr:hypothetical protein [Noviherbaspirillum malthae]
MKFDQPLGTQSFGFTTGYRAKVSFTKAVGTIVGVRNEGGEIKVTVAFGEPQQVDGPESATATRFDLGWRAIQGTWNDTATVSFDDLPFGSYFRLPEGGGEVIYLKTTRDGSDCSVVTVLNDTGVDIGCEGFLGTKCLPLPAPAIQLGPRFSDIMDGVKSEFWSAVAKRFPQCQTGDFPPDQQLAFDNACENAVRVWLDCNLPHGIQIRTEDGFLLTFGEEGFTDGDITISGLSSIATDFSMVKQTGEPTNQPPSPPAEDD